MIYNPNALPLYRDKWPGGRKRKAEYEAELAAQALRTRKPDLGQTVVSGGCRAAGVPTMLACTCMWG